MFVSSKEVGSGHGVREPLGISIEPGHGGGIFISNINDNSLTSNAGLFVGDQILEVSFL